MNPVLRVGMLVIILKRLENYVGWVLELCFVYLTYICVHIHTRDVENWSPNIYITFYNCKFTIHQLQRYKKIHLIQSVPSIIYIQGPTQAYAKSKCTYMLLLMNKKSLTYIDHDLISAYGKLTVEKKCGYSGTCGDDSQNWWSDECDRKSDEDSYTCTTCCGHVMCNAAFHIKCSILLPSLTVFYHLSKLLNKSFTSCGCVSPLKPRSLIKTSSIIGRFTLQNGKYMEPLQTLYTQKHFVR